MIDILKDTIVQNTNYCVKEDNLNCNEIDLIICYDINAPIIEVQYQANYIKNGINYGE